MVDVEALHEVEDIHLVRDLIARHIRHTGSTYARRILDGWTAQQPCFVKVVPRDYKRVLQAEARARAERRAVTFAELIGAAPAS